MSTIDVAFVVNSSAIVRDKLCTAAYSDLPNNYGTGYIFGVTGWNNVNFGTTSSGYGDNQSTNEGGAYLDVMVDDHDAIRLRTATLAAGFRHQCFIKSVTFYNGRTIATSPPVHKLDATSCMTQDAAGTVVKSAGHDDYWEIDLTTVAKAQYRLQFTLVDSDARVLGGFASYLYISAPGKSRYSID